MKYTHNCLRCSHEWESNNIAPAQCTKCKSYHYDTPRRWSNPSRKPTQPDALSADIPYLDLPETTINKPTPEKRIESQN